MLGFLNRTYSHALGSLTEILGNELVEGSTTLTILATLEVSIEVVLIQNAKLTLAIDKGRNGILTGIRTLRELEDISLLNSQTLWDLILRVVDIGERILLLASSLLRLLSLAFSLLLLLRRCLFLDRNGLLQSVGIEILDGKLLGSSLADAVVILVEVGIDIILIHRLSLTLTIDDGTDGILTGIGSRSELEDLGLLDSHTFWNLILGVVDIPALLSCRLSLLLVVHLLLLSFLLLSNLFLLVLFHSCKIFKLWIFCY